MWTWAIRKLIEGFITLIMVASLTFFLMRALPGGPFDEDRKLSAEIQAQIEARYDLDKPILTQYMVYMGNLIRGDLGPSYKYLSRSVNDIVLDASFVSFRIGFLALLLGIGSGISAALLAYKHEGKWLDKLAQTIGYGSMAVPNFVVGAMLVLAFSYYLSLLPAARLTSPLHLILPVITLSITPFSYTFLLLRSSLQEVFQQRHIRSKKSFGLTDDMILMKHGLRNALIPLIAILGPLIAGILTGSFSVEFVFGLPGLGKYFVNSVINRDYTVIMAITMLYSILLIIANIGSDILLGVADPRIRSGQQLGGKA